MCDLKPCPFCGGEVEVVKIDDKWMIDCATCERHHWEAVIETKYMGREGLIEWWNTRPETKCAPATKMNGERDYGWYRCEECGTGAPAGSIYCKGCGRLIVEWERDPDA